MDSARGFFILLLVACCLPDLAFCQDNSGDPASPSPSPTTATEGGGLPSPSPSPAATPDSATPSASPPMPVSPPPNTFLFPSMPVPSPVDEQPSPSTLEEPGNTWNASEKAGVVIASIAALLQVAVVAFLLIKRHQMLTTVDYDDIDDLESDDIRHNANYRQTGSA